MLRRRRSPREGETTIFFATDLHGAETCFKKFVAAPSFYGADLLVLGGDLTGKLVVPIVANGDGRYLSELYGEERTLRADQVDAFERDVAEQGLYAQRMSEEEFEHYRGRPEEADRLFTRLMKERLARWIDYAREKLRDTDVRVVTAPGNDDPYEVDDVIRERGGDCVLLAEGELIEVAPGHEMLNTGWSNPTPWKTHREFGESVLRAHIDEMAARLESPRTAIFNIHVPPYDSGLDTAPLLDETLAVRTSMGAQLTGPVGSTAVREALEEYQPLASLHGHIHEAGGSARIGRTVAINAGSEYGEGLLRGVLVTVGGGELLRYQLTSG
jgi:Icc-related predicted phosphoesterase